jgi:amidohydrolase
VGVEERFRQRAQELFGELCRHRRWLHQHPELSFQEWQTAEYIRTVLRELGIAYREVAQTGTVGVVGKGEPCVALRADIDALPITEQTGLPFASCREGVMHACGHDMHTAMLLGAAAMLQEHAEQLPGSVLLIFQPGEEQLPGGASLLLAEGVFEELPPRMVFGQHVYPELAVGSLAIAAGPIFAATDELSWHLRSEGGHAAQPHCTGDPVVAAAELIVHLQSIISRRRDPLLPAVLSVTSVHGGSAPNVIPTELRLCGTLRTFDAAWRRDALALIRSATEAIAALHGVEAQLEVRPGYPPLVNEERATEVVRDVAARMLGRDHVLPFRPVMWAEDFAYYSQRFPAAFWLLGVRPPGQASMPGLHHPSFAPSEEALPLGAALLAAVAWRALELLRS